MRICLGFGDLVGMTLRDFKYQPHVTGGSKCLEKHFATWYGNMFLCFEILFPQSLQTCFVWIVTRWSFNHRKHLLCSDTRTASRYIVNNKQLCLCLWSLLGWLLPSWVRCQGLSLTFHCTDRRCQNLKEDFHEQNTYIFHFGVSQNSIIFSVQSSAWKEAFSTFETRTRISFNLVFVIFNLRLRDENKNRD